MARPALAAAILAAAFAAVFASCNAGSMCRSSVDAFCIEEGCLAGPCTGGGAPSTPVPDAGCDQANCMDVAKTGDFPCDIFAIIHNNCHECHQDPPQNGAPFPLLTYADTQKPYGPTNLISQQMFDQIGPCGSPRMPLGGMLEPDDYQTLRDWLGMCAPPVEAGQGCACPGPGCTP